MSETNNTSTNNNATTRLEKKRQRDAQATEGFFTKVFGSMKKYNNRPFPWCLLPDGAWFCFGILCLLCISVPCMTNIMATTISGELIRAWMRTESGGKIYAKMRDSIHACSYAVAKVIMIDPRNHSYLPWTVFECIVIPTLAYFAWKRYLTNGFEFTTMMLYHFIRLGPRFRLFAHHQVLIHKEGHDHKGFFKGPWAALNRLNSMWMGFFYGTMTGSYKAGHNKIHHRWHNDADDVHSNIDLDRSYFSNYVLWLPRFFLYWTGISCAALFLKRAEYRLAAEIIFGQVWWFIGMCIIYKHSDLMFTLGYFVYPMGESIAFLGSMGYLWHAFVQPEDPSNQYVNSITILDGKDNIWNEDYHVVHHHAPFVHWSEAPAFYKQTEECYRQSQATIFRDCEEGELIYWIFSSKWDTLAEHFVDLNNKMNHEEKKALLLRRLKYYRLGGFHDDESGENASGWGTSEIRDWDNTSKEEQDAQKAKNAEQAAANNSSSSSNNKVDEQPQSTGEIPVTEYVDVVVDYVMNGTGEPLNGHFAPRYQSQTLDASLDKHETFLATQAKWKDGDRLLNVGCNDGRAARNIAKLLVAEGGKKTKSATRVIGVNSNFEDVARSRRYDIWANVNNQVNYVEKMSADVIPGNTFDGAFSIESFTRAADLKSLSDKTAALTDVFRSLKSGASFVGYEWVLTESFDSSNDEHKKVRSEVEMRNGLGAPLQTAQQFLAALKAAGFQVTESYDIARKVEESSEPSIPWWAALADGDYSSYASFKKTPVGRLFIKSLIGLLETVNCAPKGSSDAIVQQEEKDSSIIKAAKLGIVTPCFYFHAKKP